MSVADTTDVTNKAGKDGPEISTRKKLFNGMGFLIGITITSVIFIWVVLGQF